MKKYMHASGLNKTPGHKTKEPDIHLWKQYSKEYLNKRTGEWIKPFRCPMHYRCDCHAQVKLITRPDYIWLEFCCMHDEHSHANEKSKKLKHDQIVLLHKAVCIAHKQSGTKAHSNLCQSKSSSDKFKHMPPSMLRCIQRCVKSARDQLTE